MDANTKKIIGTLTVAAAIGGGFYLIQKGKKLLSGAKMNFALLGFRIHKVTFQEVQFAVKLRAYNPTTSPVTLAINQVVAKFKGSAFAYSTPDIKGLTVPAGGTQEIEIKFQVPYMNLIGKGITKTLLNNVQQLKANISFKLTISLNGETITTEQYLTTNDNMNGLGEMGVVSGPRPVRDGRQYNHLIKKAANKDIFVKSGNVLDTVESCVDIIAEHHNEVADLAAELKAGTIKDTCRNIFNFAYNHLQYHKDKDGTEQLRTPARSWQDGQIRFKQLGDSSAGIDCDDFSIFCGSLLKCLDIPFKIRITKYNGNSYFQHIYVYVPAMGDSDDEIIIDPVLSRFDYQKPYSFEKSDFNLTPIQMAGVNGINGLDGTVGLGLPIYALSGIDDKVVDDDNSDLMAIVSGIDFDSNMNGLGSPESVTLNYLRRTRDFLLKNNENKNKMAHIQNPNQFIDMLNQAIKYWHTPKRDKVLDKLIEIEDRLVENGLIKYDADAIDGIYEIDEIDGLGRHRQKHRHKKHRHKGRFFSAVKRIVHKVGDAAKKVGKAIVRYNPLTIAIRGGLLAALRINMFGISKKLQYAYLPDSAIAKYNIDPIKFKDLKKRHKRIIKLFKGLQGKEANLRKAILKGAKQKSIDFTPKGHAIMKLKQLKAMGEPGDLGVVATAASIGAASGVLATIRRWLRPVGNIFKKARGNAAVKKMERLIAKGKKVSPKLKHRVEQFRQHQQEAAQQAIQQQATQTPGDRGFPPNATIPIQQYDTPSFAPAQNNVNNTNAPVQASSFRPQKGLSKKTKIGLGLSVAAVLGTGAYFMFREKHEKKSLGSVVLA